MIQLDHVIIAAQTLEQGISYVQDSLRIELTHGGQHLKQGTHNKVLRLNDCYLEVIAPDPASTITPPWFGLGNQEVLESLQTPRLLTWVARCDDVRSILNNLNYPVHLQSAQRDSLRWQFSFPNDGNLISDGLLPYLIEWESQPAFHALPETGISLINLEGFHPQPNVINSQLNRLNLHQSLRVIYNPTPHLIAHLQTPAKQITLR